MADGFRLTTTGGHVYYLGKGGEILYDGRRHMMFHGRTEKWKVVGFKTRHHARATKTLGAMEVANDFRIPGQGWIMDFDHGKYRLWGGGQADRAKYLTPLATAELVKELDRLNSFRPQTFGVH